MRARLRSLIRRRRHRRRGALRRHPLGHEFTSLVLALLQVGGIRRRSSAELIEQIAQLDGDFLFETYFSLSCQNCPDVVQALNLMSVLNPRIRHVAIDGALFQDEVERARSWRCRPCS
jgi:alkyl hydroperoxide reductase subunit F